jgi:hypothetical protein
MASNMDTLLQELDLSCEAILDFDPNTSIRLSDCACPSPVRNRILPSRLEKKNNETERQNML